MDTWTEYGQINKDKIGQIIWTNLDKIDYLGINGQNWTIWMIVIIKKLSLP